MKAALLRKGRLLLLRRRADLDLWPGLWDLPGGGVSKYEDLEGALVREVFEETGFPVHPGPVLDVSFQRVQIGAEPPFPSMVCSFRCSTTSRGAPHLDATEHSDYAWVTRTDLRRLAVVPRLRRAMFRALPARKMRER